MGTISFTSVPTLTLNTAYQTSANISFSASATTQASSSYYWESTQGYADEEKKYRNYLRYDESFSFGSITYSWEFFDDRNSRVNGKSGSYTYRFLTKGAANSVQAICHISAVETNYWTITKYEWKVSYEKDEETGEDKIDENGNKIPIYTQVITYPDRTYSSESTKSTSSDTITLTVYTRPGSFTGYNFSKDTTIQSNLTATKVSNWCVHAGKYLSWKYQNNKYGTVNCNVSSGDLITAEWYNNCAAAVGSSLRVNKGDLITADAFIKLGAAISP